MELFNDADGKPTIAVNPAQVCWAELWEDHILVHMAGWSGRRYPLDGETLEEAWARLTGPKATDLFGPRLLCWDGIRPSTVSLLELGYSQNEIKAGAVFPCDQFGRVLPKERADTYASPSKEGLFATLPDRPVQP